MVEAKRNTGVELPRLYRSRGSIEGKLFEYLHQHPSGSAPGELVVAAVKAMWLPLALKHEGANGEHLQTVGRMAIAQLLQQVELIRLECGLTEVPFGGLSFLTQQVTSLHQPIAREENSEQLEPDELENEAEYVEAQDDSLWNQMRLN